MNIIFGNDYNLDSKHIVLELDTIRVGTNGPEQIAYCIVENMPIDEMPIVESLKETHHNLMTEYRGQNWTKCEQLIDQLMGKWGGEADSFYDDLLKRVTRFQQQNPGPNWSHIIQK
jgi:hypothetical protein